MCALYEFVTYIDTRVPVHIAEKSGENYMGRGRGGGGGGGGVEGELCTSDTLNFGDTRS